MIRSLNAVMLLRWHFAGILIITGPIPLQRNGKRHPCPQESFSISLSKRPFHKVSRGSSGNVQVLPLPCRVVKHSDFPSVLYQFVSHVGTDKSRAARYQSRSCRFHAIAPLKRSSSWNATIITVRAPSGTSTGLAKNDRLNDGSIFLSVPAHTPRPEVPIHLRGP